MLGVLGFTFAAILFISYSLSVRRSRSLHNFRVHSFANAYLLLAFACISWAFAALIGTNALQAGVIVGDAFVLAGTICMLDAITPNRYRSITIGVSSIIAIAALVSRAAYLPPHPYLSKGILLFNSHKVATVLFVAVFILVWFPITMHFVSKVLQKNNLVYLGKAGILACVLAVLGVCGFLSATTKLGVVVYFVVLCCAFAALIAIDYVGKTEQRHG